MIFFKVLKVLRDLKAAQRCLRRVGETKMVV